MQASSEPGSTWQPECAEDELLVALVGIKREMHATQAGVDPGVFPVLHQLAATGQMRQGQLAEVIGLDASTISRHVRALLDDELIQAHRDPSDGRATVLSVTPAGKDSLIVHLKAKRESFRAGTINFSAEERSELIRLLNKFACGLAASRESK